MMCVTLGTAQNRVYNVRASWLQKKIGAIVHAQTGEFYARELTDKYKVSRLF